MKAQTLIQGLFLTFIVSSCIQDEALNKEAAIDAITGNDVQLTNINVNSKQINIYVQRGADLSKQQLCFTLPDGATIRTDESYSGDTDFSYNQSNGTYDATLNFSESANNRSVTVISEDGAFTPQYNITLTPSELPETFHFEHLLENVDEPYDILYEFEPSTSQGVSKVLQWSSGNPGYELTAMAQSAADYPTVRAAGGQTGQCVKLETKDTGSFGSMVGMYIASGNLFVGSFDLSNALNAPLEATRFGYQFYKHPIQMTGYFKYKAGDVYTEEGVVVEGKKDRFDIYATLYEAEDNTFTLNGNNSLSHSSIVSMARIAEEDAIETDEWTAFDLTFEAQNGKTIDEQKLQDGKYKLAIVFASSVEGAYFNGAVGSTLYVDEVRLICQD